jgi:hypothetical protein
LTSRLIRALGRPDHSKIGPRSVVGCFAKHEGDVNTDPPANAHATVHVRGEATALPAGHSPEGAPPTRSVRSVLDSGQVDGRVATFHAVHSHQETRRITVDFGANFPGQPFERGLAIASGRNGAYRMPGEPA